MGCFFSGCFFIFIGIFQCALSVVQTDRLLVCLQVHSAYLLKVCTNAPCTYTATGARVGARALFNLHLALNAWL